MTIIGKEDQTFDVTLSQSEKSNDLVKITGKASILAGLLLIVFGLQSADTLSAQAQPQQKDEGSVFANSEPLKLGTTFQNGPVNGRIDDVDIQVITQPNSESRNNAEISVSKSRQGNDVSTELVVSDSESEADPVLADKAIWLAIHQPEYELEWLDEVFTISHYTYALESDPLYANDDLIQVPGLPDGDMYKAGFIFGGRGILQQGTGLAENGQYITIDWDRSYHDAVDVSKNRWFFRYGIGRPVVPWKTVATHHSDLPQGTQIVIETYFGEHRFIVGDGGLDLAHAQIDVFIGNMTIAEADQFGVTWSRVGIIRPINYLLPNQAADVSDEREVGTFSD